MVTLDFPFGGDERRAEDGRNLRAMLLYRESASRNRKNNPNLIVPDVMMWAMSDSHSCVGNFVGVSLEFSEFILNQAAPALLNLGVPPLNVDLHSASLRMRCSFASMRFHRDFGLEAIIMAYFFSGANTKSGLGLSLTSPS
jgi:hypothetical protein